MRVLNIGGFANPDVLLVDGAHGERLIVKDYARRSGWVRRTLAPLLIRHELTMLDRLRGVGGVPESRGRIDRLAFAMEYLEGRPLEARRFAKALPPRFFAELESTLEAFARAGVFHTDLRSPTNVLVRADGRPGVVDLASVWRLPLPRALSRALERSALRKLRRRFEGDQAVAVERPEYRDIHVGRARIRTTDVGPLADPVPAVLIPEPGWPAEVFDREAEALVAAGRRAIGLELAGFGGSRPRAGARAVHTPEGAATELGFMLDVLRLRRVDLVGRGFAMLAVRELAQRAPGRVRARVGIGAPWTSKPESPVPAGGSSTSEGEASVSGEGCVDEAMRALLLAARAGVKELRDAVLQTAEAELPAEFWPAVRRGVEMMPRDVSSATYRGLAEALEAARLGGGPPRWLLSDPSDPRHVELSRERARDPAATVAVLLSAATAAGDAASPARGLRAPDRP